MGEGKEAPSQAPLEESKSETVEDIKERKNVRTKTLEKDVIEEAKKIAMQKTASQ